MTRHFSKPNKLRNVNPSNLIDNVAFMKKTICALKEVRVQEGLLFFSTLRFCVVNIQEGFLYFRKLCLWWYFTLSVRPSVRAVTFWFLLDILK